MNEVPGYRDWFFGAITREKDGTLVSEVYKNVNGHDYPGHTIRANDHHELVKIAQQTIDNSHRLFPHLAPHDP